MIQENPMVDKLTKIAKILFYISILLIFLQIIYSILFFYLGASHCDLKDEIRKYFLPFFTLELIIVPLCLIFFKVRIKGKDIYLNKEKSIKKFINILIILFILSFCLSGIASFDFSCGPLLEDFESMNN